MPTYEKCDLSINQLAKELIAKYETNQPLEKAGVKIDFVFAYASLDDNGITTGDAITKNGQRVLGFTRIMSLKDRAMGRGDVEIMLDGDHWKQASAEEQAALLDHELHHVSVKANAAGIPKFDDLGRPQIRLRQHDIEVGWFSVIAFRHGIHSQERQQARQIMDDKGQYLWPDLVDTVTLITDGKSTGPLPIGAFAKAAAQAV